MAPNYVFNMFVNAGIYPDLISKNKKGNFIFRKSFFYRTTSVGKIVLEIKEKFPDIEIIDTWEKFVPFRGGSTVSQGSHYGIEFNLKEIE